MALFLQDIVGKIEHRTAFVDDNRELENWIKESIEESFMLGTQSIRRRIGKKGPNVN